MSLELIIARFGLAAIFAGAALEGETALIAGGILAHQHIFLLPSVAIAGGLGSFAADQGFFLLGRHFRDHPRVEQVLEKPAAEKVLSRLERYPTAFILGFRFLYGLRTVSPIAVGTSEISQLRFLALNAIAASLWAVLFTGVGYAIGGPLGQYFHDPKSIVPAAIGGLLIFGVTAFLGRMAWKTLRHMKRKGRRDC